MSKSLADALGEGAWSVSAVMFDLNAMLDDEGRPISERRADASARIGVEMDMQLCPFGGIRENKWMNVSALAQINRYYKDILAEMAAFRREAGANATWDDMLACIVELLAGPALYLLQQRNLQGPVPARVAVGHKLAAGFFGVMRGLHERLAQGEQITLGVDTFLGLVDKTGALVGTSEVCAGSLPMIRKATTALLEGDADNLQTLAPLRLEVAHCLALQVQLGIFWHLYDRVHAWSLIKGEFREHLHPCNHFLQRKLEHAQVVLEEHAPARPNSAMLPASLAPHQCQQLMDALNDAAAPRSLEEDISAASQLLNESVGAITYHGAAEPLALHVANYLNTYRHIETELSRVERELRGHLEFPLDSPIRLGTAVFPPAQALPWYELILGRRLGTNGHLTGNKVRPAMAGDAH